MPLAPTLDASLLESEIAACACGCAALDLEVDECQPDPERGRPCRLAVFLECLSTTGHDAVAAERASINPATVEAWIAAGEAPDAPEPLAAFALAARRARAKSEEAVLIAAKAQSLDDGRLGLDYLRTTHPDRYADRRGKGVEVNVATVQQTFDPAAVVRNLKNFARREGLIVEADSDG